MEFNNKDHLLVVGCNYHTSWQSHKAMRFVLKDIINGQALLTTRRTRKVFWTNVNDLIFIYSGHNLRKAKDILKTNFTQKLNYASKNS